MAAPVSPTVPPPVDAYRPVSMLAVVGCGLSVASVAVFLLATDWLIVFPIVGLIISLIALQRIKKADNALAGAGIARIGIALGLVISLSWATMQLTSYIVLQYESTRFVEQWLECIRDGKDSLAFIATTQPRNRPDQLKAEDLETRMLRAKYASPDGPAYDKFLAVPTAELLLRGGKDIRWEKVGTPEFYYYQGSWNFRHRYRVYTPETEMDIIFKVISDDVQRQGAPRREWRLDIAGSNMVEDSSVALPYGRDLSKARQDAFRALNYWISLVGYAKKDAAAAQLQDAPQVRNEFNQLYNALRPGAGNEATVALKGKQFVVLKAKQEGKKWSLTLRGTVETGPRDVDFQITWENDDVDSPKSNWAIADLKYLGDRKRMDPATYMK
jgi:hypothetical protein